MSDPYYSSVPESQQPLLPAKQNPASMRDGFDEYATTYHPSSYSYPSGNHVEVNNAKQRNGYDHLTRDKFNQSRNEFTNFNQSCLNTPAAAYNYNQLNLNAHA